jgi:hypothetical protein
MIVFGTRNSLRAQVLFTRRQHRITMRTGIIHAAIVTAVAVNVGALEVRRPSRRPVRKLIHTTARISEASSGSAANNLSRSLGVGLDDVQYGKGKGKGKEKSKGKVTGDDYDPPDQDDDEGKGKGGGHYPDDDYDGNIESDDDIDDCEEAESPVLSPIYSPVGSPVAAAPTIEGLPVHSPVVHEKKEKTSKTEKSKLSRSKSGKKDCPIYSPISTPTEDRKLRVVVYFQSIS